MLENIPVNNVQMMKIFKCQDYLGPIESGVDLTEERRNSKEEKKR